MATNGSTATLADVEATLDTLAANDATQSNCMFQLALMLARICRRAGFRRRSKTRRRKRLLALIRAKPKSNVLRMFSDDPTPEPAPALMVATA